MALLDRLRGIPAWLDARLQPVRSTLPYRAYARYSAVRGNVLAGGVAYFAFFSIFPALAVGFTVFALLLGNQESLQAQVVQFVNSSLGTTVISYHQGQQGIVTIDQLVQPTVLTATAVVGLVTLVLSGLGWIAALRDGVQAVFGVRDDTNFLVVKLVEFVLLVAGGLAVLASVVVSVGVNVASGEVLDMLGIGRSAVAGWAVNIAGQLVLVVVDTAIFTLLFARLSRVDVPVRDVATGGAVGGVGFTVLKLFATELLTVMAHNRFLAASGIIVGLLVWMNLVARLLLVAAAWSATVASDRGHLRTPDPAALAASSTPPPTPADLSSPEQPAAAGADSRRAARTLLVAGFLAGAFTARLAARGPRRRAPKP
jgi:membrane protein